MTPLLEIRDLLVCRETRPVVEVDHLAVEQGNVLAVVGPNGAGKTSLLLAVAHLIKPERGQIFFNGEEIPAKKELHYRRRIALVLQEPLLFSQSVYQNTALGLHFRGVPKEEIARRVDHWLDDWASPTCATAGRTNSPAAKRSASAWRGLSCCNPSSCCWTNPSAPSTLPPVADCSTNCIASWRKQLPPR